jgi:ATP/maltotriose-dependent transcriptional regulator MalT
VGRPRLLSTLALRWERRLVTIVAGPGFGKTALLAAALADHASDPDRRDVWLCCEPPDESEERLVAGLAQAAALPADADLRHRTRREP